MAKKTKKRKATKRAAPAKLKPASAELRPNQLTIKFDHEHQVLPKLLELAQHYSDGHAELLSKAATSTDVLGGARARVIVSGCAHSTSWQSTLGELGLNLLIFCGCVAKGVESAGYVPPDDTPCSGDTKLIEVVAAIQGAPHQ